MMNLVFDLRQEEGLLGLVGGQGERLPVGVGGLAGPAEPAEQVGPDRVQVLVAREPAVGVEPLDLGQRRLLTKPSMSASAWLAATSSLAGVATTTG